MTTEDEVLVDEVEVNASEVKFRNTVKNIRNEARKLRDTSGMTVKEIATRAGVSVATVSKATNPKSEDDLKISTLMGVLYACQGDIQIRVLKNGEPIMRELSDIDIL